MSQQAFQEGYTNNKSSNFASDYEQHVEESGSSAVNEVAGYLHTESSTFESSDYNRRSETTDTYPAEESETSPDELALDTRKSTASNKRRNKASEKTVFKAPHHGDGKSRRKRRSKR